MRHCFVPLTSPGSRAVGLVALLCTCFLGSGIAGAVTITQPLSSLVGTYDPGLGASKQQSFDLGVQFSVITEAKLSLTFSGSTGVFQSCPLLGCTPIASDLFPGLFGALQNPLSLFSPNNTGDSSTDLTNVDFDFFWPDLGRLLDGADEVSMNLDSIVCIGTCFFSTNPQAVVTAASVSVTGTLVPEPGTGVLVAAGLLGMTGVPRRRADTAFH